MEDEDSNQNMEKNFFRKSFSEILNVGNVFQSFRVRRGTIFFNFFDGEFMVRKFNFVLRIGIIFWVIFLFSKVI